MSKIISGHLQGMNLKVAKNSTTRPTSARIRESVLNSLQLDINGKNFLDLYAGSGAMGLEALSRGANSCVFVEQDKDAFKTLQENISLAKDRLNKQQVAYGTVQAYCANASFPQKIKLELGFDYIWLDPPYNAVTTILTADFFMEIKNLAHPNSLLLVEMAHKDVEALKKIFSVLSSWKLNRVKRMGQTAILDFCTHD